jgi:PAS domain S-box-containing protein
MQTQPTPSAKIVKQRGRALTELRTFSDEHEHGPVLTELYRNAEARLRKQKKNQRTKVVEMNPEDDPHRLLHKLQVHQIELEMQNTELQEARNRTEVLLEKYTDLYDFAPAGYFSLDERGQILEVNLTGTTLLGVRRSQLINRRLQSFITPMAQPDFLTFLKRVFEGTGNQVCEATLLREEGTPFFANFQGIPAVSVTGPQKWCRIVVTDITARQQAENALRLSEERFRALFEVGPVAIYSCDSLGMIQEFNRRAVELWGREPALGNPKELFCGSFKLFRPDGMIIPRAKFPMAEVLSGKKSEILDVEGIVERPDGSRINCIVNIRPLKDQYGNITGAINCFYDITERKQAEAAQRRIEVLAASNEKLEKEIVRRQVVEESLKKNEQYQSELLAQSRLMQGQLRNLSRQILHAQEEERKRISRELHDVIAQTLTGINLCLATLKKNAGRNPKVFKRTLTRTQWLVAKSVNIVHEFARELRPAVLDDLGLIPALHSFMKNFTAQTGVRAHLTAFAALEKLEASLRTVLYRVAQEALTNVSRHAQASRVEVIIQQLADGICMKIKDNGKSLGVERALHAGTGKRLGLLGMRERLEMVGGNFSVESVPGQGTTVIARIPTGKVRRIRPLTL